MHSLKVSMQNKLVGQVFLDENDNYHFEYCQDWIEYGFAISPHLGIQIK